MWEKIGKLSQANAPSVPILCGVAFFLLSFLDPRLTKKKLFQFGGGLTPLSPQEEKEKDPFYIYTVTTTEEWHPPSQPSLSRYINDDAGFPRGINCSKKTAGEDWISFSGERHGKLCRKRVLAILKNQAKIRSCKNSPYSFSTSVPRKILAQIPIFRSFRFDLRQCKFCLSLGCILRTSEHPLTGTEYASFFLLHFTLTPISGSRWRLCLFCTERKRKREFNYPIFVFYPLKFCREKEERGKEEDVSQQLNSRGKR